MQDFKRLRVWVAARSLAVDAYRLTGDRRTWGEDALAGQIRRAAISVAANIAEGCGRGTRRDFLRFLNMSMASAGFARRPPPISERRSTVNGQRSTVQRQPLYRVIAASTPSLIQHSIASAIFGSSSFTAAASCRPNSSSTKSARSPRIRRSSSGRIPIRSRA